MEKIVATKIWGQRSLLQQCAHRVAIMKIDLQPSGHERWSNVQFSNKISTQQCFPLRGKHCCVEFCCWIQTILQPNLGQNLKYFEIWLQYWKILQKIAKRRTFGCNIENTATEGVQPKVTELALLPHYYYEFCGNSWHYMDVRDPWLHPLGCCIFNIATKCSPFCNLLQYFPIQQPNFKIFQILSQIWLQYWKILQQKVAKNLTFGCNIENTATEGCNRRSRSLRYCFILQPAMLQYSGNAWLQSFKRKI